MMGGGVAKGLHADAGMTGWVFARRTPPHAYGRWGTSPQDERANPSAWRPAWERVRGFSPRRHLRRHRRDHSSLPVLCRRKLCQPVPERAGFLFGPPSRSQESAPMKPR